MKIDGRKIAKEIESRVKVRVSELEKKPKIVSVLVGSDPASELYTRLKGEAAERVGVEFEIVRLELDNLGEEIARIGMRKDVDGVMVQTPLLRQGFGGQAIPLSKNETKEIISMIPLEKDVDGLRWEESGVMPATVRAVMAILDKIAKIENELWQRKFVVVGDRGSVGKPLMQYLRKRGVENLAGVNSETVDPTRRLLVGDVVISCVGKEGVVTGSQVREGVIVVDVGAPRGDMMSEVYEKASVSVEVPGGVGPVTVVSLMENALEMGRNG